MITIPNPLTKQITQPNTSDILGTLYASFGMDLTTNKGKFRAGRRLILNTNTVDVAELTSYPVGFRYFNNGSDSSYYTAAGTGGTGYAFKSLAIDATFAKVTTSGAPTALDSTTTDIESGFGELYFSEASSGKVYYVNGSNVWANLSAGSAGYASMLCFFPATQRMYCSKNGNLIQSWDSAHTVASSGANTLTLGTGEIIVWMRASADRIFIGTVNTSGGKGYIYEWDGVSTQYQVAHRLQASGALAAVVKDDVPFVMDSNAQLLKWNGGIFQKLTGIYRKRNKPLFNPYATTNQRFIHPNGMSVVNGYINALLDLTNYDVTAHGGTQEDCNPSGIWEYDGEILPNNPLSGTNTLYHKHPFTLTKSGASLTDYGQTRIFGAGGLSEILTAASPVTTNGTFLAGCTYYTDMATPTKKSGIFYDDTNDTVAKSAYFITSKIFAGASKQAILDEWSKVYAIHEPFLSVNNPDKIIIKYRKYNDVALEGNITWTSTTTFTTTVDMTNYAIGDDVHVLAGLGAGFPTRISAAPSNNAGTWTVTVENVFSGASNQVSYARFSHWILAGVITDSEDHGDVPIGTPNSYIQLRVHLFWAGANELNLLIPVNNKDTEVES